MLTSFYTLRPVAETATSPPTLLAPSQTSDNVQQPFSSRPAYLPLDLPGLRRKLETQSLAYPVRVTQVTDSLSETVQAKLHQAGNPGGERAAPNYGSSGSAHEPSSVCLMAMVHEFLEDAHVGSCGRARCNCVSGTCSGEGCITSDPDRALPTPGDDDLREILEELLSCTNTMESRLHAHVSKAVQASQKHAASICNCEGEGANSSNECLLRWVMKCLRLEGYDAAVCKSRWEHTGGFPAGDYEYVDVSTEKPADRLFVDTNFRAQFEIARASSQYNALLQILPCIFVGSAKRLEQILKIMSEAIKISLEDMGMPLPPWRRHWYMRAKWFSSYKRTTNEWCSSHRNSERILNREFAAIALRGPRFCDQFKEEVERFYQRSGGGRGAQENSPAGSGICANCAVEAYETQEKRAEIITVMSTDWQLPPLEPRNIKGSGGASGLANAFRKAAHSAPTMSFACKPSPNRQQARPEPVVC